MRKTPLQQSLNIKKINITFIITTNNHKSCKEFHNLKKYLNKLNLNLSHLKLFRNIDNIFLVKLD